MSEFSGLRIFIVTPSLVSLTLSHYLWSAPSPCSQFSTPPSYCVSFRFFTFLFLYAADRTIYLPSIPHITSQYINSVSPDQNKAKTRPAEYLRNPPRTD